MSRPAGAVHFSGAALKVARLTAKLSCGTLSQRLFQRGHTVSYETIRRWELGNHEPTGAVLYALAVILRRRLEYFLRPDTEPEGDP